MSTPPNCLNLREKYTTACLLFLIPTLYFLYSLFVIQLHDWDLDAFLYLGSRLHNGELLYLRDFETKLPLVQYLFWIPYYLGGIGAWRLITFAISFSLALISSHVIVQSLTHQSPGLHLSSRKITALSAAAFLTFLYSLPGSLSAQIEMFAASFMYFAIALWHRAVAKKRHANIYILLSGIAAGIAVSIRPNYLFVMPTFFLFSILCAATSANLERYTHPIKQVTLFAVVSSITIVLQFVPYLLIRNGPSTLLGALLSLGSQFSWGSVFDIFHDEFLARGTVAFYIFMCLGTGTLMPIAYSQFREHSSDLRASIFLSGALLCAASILGLEYSFIKTHYYDDNSILFVPYASVVFTYLCIFVSRHRLLRWDFVKSGIAILAGWYLSVMVTPVWQERSRIMAPKLNFSINYRNIDSVLAEFLHRVVSMGMSFYVSDSTIYHVVLNHERIGDGHPVMLFLVLSGRRIGPIDSIFLYSDTVHKNPCLALWESHKDIIVVSEDDPLVVQCLLSTDSGYKEISFDHGLYQIFARRPYVDRILKNVPVSAGP